MEFLPLITRVFASFFPVTHHSPPNLKMISKNKMCILVWGHFVFHQRTGLPWKRGQRQGEGKLLGLLSYGRGAAAVTDTSTSVRKG